MRRRRPPRSFRAAVGAAVGIARTPRPPPLPLPCPGYCKAFISNLRLKPRTFESADDWAYDDEGEG